MTGKVVALYFVVLILGAAMGVTHSYLRVGLVLPDAIISGLIYAILALVVLVTAHVASTWGGEGADIDLDI